MRSKYIKCGKVINRPYIKFNFISNVKKSCKNDMLIHFCVVSPILTYFLTSLTQPLC